MERAACPRRLGRCFARIDPLETAPVAFRPLVRQIAARLYLLERPRPCSIRLLCTLPIFKKKQKPDYSRRNTKPVWGIKLKCVLCVCVFLFEGTGFNGTPTGTGPFRGASILRQFQMATSQGALRPGLSRSLPRSCGSWTARTRPPAIGTGAPACAWTGAKMWVAGFCFFLFFHICWLL